MTFSIGQNFFDNLLESSDKRTRNDNKAITQTYNLQQRLNDYWKNNNKPVLLKSQKLSGMTNILGKHEPLGGNINWSECGTTNVPGSCKNGCPDEYAFWGTSDLKVNNEKIVEEQEQEQEEQEEQQEQEQEQKEIIEKFTILNNRENFMSGNTSNIVLIILIIVLIIFGFGGYLFFTRKKISIYT